MKVRVDEHKCVGSGLCVLQAPNVFDQGHHGIVKLRDAAVSEDDFEDVIEAADTCPSGAIDVED